MRCAIVVALALLGACSKDEPKKAKPAAAIPAAEVQRGRDACKLYVERVCACNAPAAKQQCGLAKGLPEAYELAAGVALNPQTDPDDARRAQVNMRETTKECIEQTAKLPGTGCP
jgi:hypothetical protein